MSSQSDIERVTPWAGTGAGIACPSATGRGAGTTTRRGGGEGLRTYTAHLTTR